MNYLQLSSQQVIPQASTFVALISAVPDLGLLSNTFQVLCVKVDFPLFNLSQKYSVSSLLVKTSNSSDHLQKASFS